MALTNAEKQTAHRERQQKTMANLAEANAALIAENTILRAEVASLKEKLHALEVRALKVQLKAKG